MATVGPLSCQYRTCHNVQLRGLLSRCFVFKSSQQLIWRLCTCRLHLRLPDLHMNIRDLPTWLGTRMIVPAMFHTALLRTHQINSYVDFGLCCIKWKQCWLQWFFFYQSCKINLWTQTCWLKWDCYWKHTLYYICSTFQDLWSRFTLNCVLLRFGTVQCFPITVTS